MRVLPRKKCALEVEGRGGGGGSERESLTMSNCRQAAKFNTTLVNECHFLSLKYDVYFAENDHNQLLTVITLNTIHKSFNKRS